ncbi:MAG: 4-hydroxythreonine-4-phosphate dehydrogenase PdxA [Solirubrobacteraceae bacterium]
MSERPVVGITVGDPAGIGPEVVLGACLDPEVRAACEPVLIGSLERLRATASVLRRPTTLVDVADAGFGEDAISVSDVPGVPVDHPFGVVTAAAGRASYDYIVEGVRLAAEHRIAALVTAPINKQALREAGVGHQGHTELLAGLTDAPWSQTLFVVEELRVLFLTRHMSLADAISRVTRAEILQALQRFSSVSRMVGLEHPVIGVQALNPHAGDGGLFGDEDDTVIAPAVEEARTLGIDAQGPVPADSVFALGRAGRYHVVLSLYHDIAAGVCKAIDFDGTVSITLGLPFLRFSVDHGTAFDIAGKGIATSANMVQTILRAADHARGAARAIDPHQGD